MQVHLWGVRGSLASGGEAYMHHGGNTSCYGIEVAEAPYIILDAGSGIRNFGESIKDAPKVKKCALFLTHSHWDHVSGLPFFDCLYKKGWEIDIYAPESIGGMTADAFVKSLFSSSFFPVSWESLASTRRIIPLKDQERITLEGGVTVTPYEAWHGGDHVQGLYATAYRVEYNGHSVFYSGDHELGLEVSEEDKKKSFFQGLRGADIAILDSQYTLSTYKDHVGWGHSAIEQWIPLIEEFNVKTFVPSHYGPYSDDEYLDNLAHGLLSSNENLCNRMCMAYEGLILRCADIHTSPHEYVASMFDCDNCSFSSELMNIPDISTVLDLLLLKARGLAHADAGTIYLVEDGQLVFSYSHNETLFTSSQSARQQYLNARLPMTPESIAGYVACNRSVLNIGNVRNLPEGAPYSFNDSFDKATGYNTVSICALPIVSADGELLAVMQIINSMFDGSAIPFSFQVERSLRELCIVGAQVIEQALVTVDMLLRVLETTRLRDPLETGPHVLRVGSMAAELYHHWALKKGIDLVEILAAKPNIRLASMLHDVGKVGISDKVLKKPGRFTPEERAIMEKHSCIGAEIFKGAKRTVDKMAATIALHHHQRWDGKGYTGIEGDCPLAGTDIPMEARITSIVDVFDALVSRRCYKEPMPLDKALSIIKSESGTAFDPEMVESFMEILDTMMAIQSKYQDIIIEPKSEW